MALTTPDNIRTPNDNDQYALVQDLGVMADSIQAALVKRANYFTGTAAQRTAFTTAPEGVTWRDTNGTMDQYVRQAGVWVRVKVAAEVATGTVLHPGSSSTLVLTFPAGRFSTTPTVVCNAITGDTAHNVYASGVSTTQCTINYTRTSNTNVNWIASTDSA